ncbi:MAG: hypothetical protein NUK65_13355, partial [Firmicutes bacterium]|nr:hypothetical protein [Bacillota bacterium]
MAAEQEAATASYAGAKKMSAEKNVLADISLLRAEKREIIAMIRMLKAEGKKEHKEEKQEAKNDPSP